MAPSTFAWSQEQSEYGAVFVDGSIPEGLNYNIKKYAWLLESPELLKPLIDYIRANRKLISYSYKALFTCVESLVGLEPNFYYCPSGSNLPWIQQHKIYEKTKLCSMIASTKRYATGHFKREEIAIKFQNKIDLYGGTLNSPKLGTGIHPDKFEGISPYMFSIVIENCKHDKYYTEKVTDCFATGTIPVYWGTDKITEDFNSEGIINLTDDFDINTLTKELYESKMDAIQDNFERVKNLTMADDYLFARIQELA